MKSASVKPGEGLTAAEFQQAASWPVLQDLRMRVRVMIHLPPMTLGRVQRLAVGDVIVSPCPAGQEVPLLVGGADLSWCEFAVVDGMMAARLTRLR